MSLLTFGDVVVPSEEVERAVRERVVDTFCGIDGIYAEHMLYSSHVLFRLLGLCMSSYYRRITIVPSLWLVLSAISW